MEANGMASVNGGDVTQTSDVAREGARFFRGIHLAIFSDLGRSTVRWRAVAHRKNRRSDLISAAGSRRHFGTSERAAIRVKFHADGLVL